MRQAYERGDLFLADFGGVTRWVVDTVLGLWVGWPLGDLLGDVAFDTWTSTFPTSPEVWA